MLPMQVIINGRPKDLEGLDHLSEAMNAEGVSKQKGIAVAINDHVIPRSEWAGRKLLQGDKILIIRASAGG